MAAAADLDPDQRAALLIAAARMSEERAGRRPIDQEEPRGRRATTSTAASGMAK